MRKLSKKHEKSIARGIGGTVQPNSGATPYRKGDVIHERFLFDGKTVEKPQKSITIKKADIEKLETERFAMRREFSALVFNFEPDGENYYAIKERTLRTLLEEAKENDYE